MMKASDVLVSSGRKNRWLLNVARKSVINSRGRAYARTTTRVSVEPRSAVFQAYGGRSYACGPRALYLQILADPAYEGYELVWTLRAGVAQALADAGGFDVRGLEAGQSVAPGLDLTRDFGDDALEELRRAVIVVYESPDHYRALAKAGLWITNSMLPDHVHPREGQLYVQLWHGTPLKRLGNDILVDQNPIYTRDAVHERYRLEGERLSLMIAPCEFAADAFRSAFALRDLGKAGVVHVTGYPRNDALSTADADRVAADRVAAVRARLKIPEGKRVILYAPTWRDDDHVGARLVNRSPVDFDLLHEELGDEFVMVYRTHYLTTALVDLERHKGFLINASTVNDINDLYLVSDMLVTDYSSVFFDYAVLMRPTVFFMYDLEHYAEEIRGFYLSLDELPGPIVRTEHELVAAVREATSPLREGDELLRAFRSRYAPLDDGHAAERVISLVADAAAGGGVRQANGQERSEGGNAT